MRVGDLVRPVRHLCATTAPIVEEGWVGVVIGFTGDYCSPEGEVIVGGRHPIVYWNPKFHAEVEYPDQVEVIGESRRSGEMH